MHKTAKLQHPSPKTFLTNPQKIQCGIHQTQHHVIATTEWASIAPRRNAGRGEANMWYKSSWCCQTERSVHQSILLMSDHLISRKWGMISPNSDLRN